MSFASIINSLSRFATDIGNSEVADKTTTSLIVRDTPDLLVLFEVYYRN